MYAHAENNIVTYLGSLPKTWRNISGFNKLDGDDAYLKTLGWLPLVEEPATLGSDEVSTGWVQSIGAEAITSTEGKRAMTAEEKAARDSGLAQQEINRLEALETPTRIAEAVLTVDGKAWLQANRDLIAAETAKM